MKINIIKVLLKNLLFLGVFFVLLLVVIYAAYEIAYINKIYPGVYINGVHFGNRSKEEVKAFFETKNKKLRETKFNFIWQEKKWAMSGGDLNLSYEASVISEEAYRYGRRANFFRNFVLKWQAFWNNFKIEAGVGLDEVNLKNFFKSISLDINKEPVEGLFEFKDGKVTAFRPAQDGRMFDIEAATKLLEERIKNEPLEITLVLPVNIVKPKYSTERAENMGIKELIGKGESYFRDSIESRIFNIKLGAEKFHGVLIEPNEVFSFNKKVGTVSAFTGYKQAYVIEKGKTVLGDGGGVCQVSTTLYRAALYAGLPVVERVPHTYRVGYYEPPVGFDATVYDPSPDFRFKNDTGKFILIQTIFDAENQKLTFELYGTSDGREILISESVIVSTSPAPEPKYQDDPNLPKGTEKQIDTAHAGAKVYFTRKVVRDGTELINETVWSNYIPWAAVILRGIKE